MSKYLVHNTKIEEIEVIADRASNNRNSRGYDSRIVKSVATGKTRKVCRHTNKVYSTEKAAKKAFVQAKLDDIKAMEAEIKKAKNLIEKIG